MANTIWERLFESTEGPTVTLRIPRQLAEDLLAALSAGIESGDGMDDAGIELDLDPDADDADGDDDDSVIMFGDDDDSDDDDDDDEKDESADCSTDGMRPKTALGEKYVGFDKLKGKLDRKGVRNPAGLAADIGRAKYGKGKFQGAAAKGKKLG